MCCYRCEKRKCEKVFPSSNGSTSFMLSVLVSYHYHLSVSFRGTNQNLELTPASKIARRQCGYCTLTSAHRICCSQVHRCRRVIRRVQVRVVTLHPAPGFVWHCDTAVPVQTSQCSAPGGTWHVKWKMHCSARTVLCCLSVCSCACTLILPGAPVGGTLLLFIRNMHLCDTVGGKMSELQSFFTAISVL